ncbi:MAG: hypothetical protein M3Q31_15175 [Actinomycetota bacterium]|nr:hypothetical protein [Actinomycetota bacterium]
MNTFARCSAIVVVPVDLLELPAWEPGPLPVSLGSSVASAALRRSYFNERAATALYGSGRLHRWMGAEHGRKRSCDRFEVAGVELLCVPARGDRRNALLAVHGEIQADGLDAVETLTRIAQLGNGGSQARAFLDELLDGCGSVMSGLKRATTITLATPAAGSLAAPLGSPAFDAWNPDLQWLWLLASATLPGDYLPAPEDGKGMLGSIIHLSANWKVLVLRDGAAYLGSGADMSSAYRLADDAEFHFRTIYLDALLVAQSQRLQLTRIADELAALADPMSDPAPLLRLERELTAFRNVYWWQHLGPQWHANRLLSAYQAGHEITELFDQVTDELGDYSRKAHTAATQRTEALVGVLAVVGLPLGAALELVHALSVDNPWWIALALALAVLLIAGILLTGAGRTLLRLWIMVGRRDP